MKIRNAQGDAPLDILFAELARASVSADYASILDLCLHGRQKEIAAIPLRYRLIALGFVKKLSPEEVNRRLLENGCSRLYARSYWEASVIFALKKGMSYARWKGLLAQCGSLREDIASSSHAFLDKTITLSAVRRYVDDNSLRDADFNATMHVTKAIEKELAASTAGNEGEQVAGQKEFQDYLLSNLASFSTVREKARYYFCKYLLYDLDNKKKECIELLGAKTASVYKKAEGLPSDSVLLQDLHVFKVLSRLRRKRHTREEISGILENSVLSLGTIYALYDRFYFSYPFHDWVQILADIGTDPLTLPPDISKALSDAARRDTIRRKVQKPAELSDTGLLKWLKEELKSQEDEWEKGKTSYQSGREGENFLRKVLRGTLDLDRTTLLSFLLYFGHAASSEIPSPHRINRGRLNAILEESGFPVLDPDLPFDSFVCDFLESPDPGSFLIEQAEKMALSGKNFYFHRTWRLAESGEDQWLKLT